MSTKFSNGRALIFRMVLVLAVCLPLAVNFQPVAAAPLAARGTTITTYYSTCKNGTRAKMSTFHSINSDGNPPLDPNRRSYDITCLDKPGEVYAPAAGKVYAIHNASSNSMQWYVLLDDYANNACLMLLHMGGGFNGLFAGQEIPVGYRMGTSNGAGTHVHVASFNGACQNNAMTSTSEKEIKWVELGYVPAYNVTAGSPIFFTSKNPSPEGLTYCGKEGQTCAFAGLKNVMFGARGAFATGAFVSSTLCSTSIFGDPASGTGKQCYYLNPALALPTSAIMNKNNGKYLDVSGSAVILNTKSTAISQKWYLLKTADSGNFFYIISATNLQCIQAPNTAANASLVLAGCQNTPAQKWEYVTEKSTVTTYLWKAMQANLYFQPASDSNGARLTQATRIAGLAWGQRWDKLP